MASHPYCFLLTLAAVAISYLDCDADMSRTPERTVHYHDVIDASCQQQLSDDIEACLSGYEQLLVSSRALESKPGQLQRPVARRLCRRYYETLQCLHFSLLKCSADQPHLYLIASRVGHLRTFMEQTCATVNLHTTTTIQRHPAEVTLRRRDDVISVTPPPTTTLSTTPVTRLSKKDSDDSHSVVDSWSKCSDTTAGSPKSLPLHSCAMSSTSTPVSISLISAVVCTILRRHCPA